MKFILKTLTIIAGLSLTCAFANNQFSATLSGNYGYAKTDGFLQIPIGGQVGTSSLKRPDLSELGIDNSGLWNVNLDLMYKQWGAFIGYQNQENDESKTLQQNLITHGVFYPSGTKVHSEVKFNLLSGGLFYNFNHQNYTLRPELAVTALDFSYDIHSTQMATGRHFTQATPRLGLELIYHATPKLDLSLGGLSSIPNLANLDVYSANLKASYQFYQKQNYSASVFAGLEYQQIYFKDKQTLPNNMKLTNWPMGVIGLSFHIE